MSQENSNVRKVVITHMTDLMKANRDFFHELIVNEELSSMHFLTVAHDSSEVESSAGTLKGENRNSLCYCTRISIWSLKRFTLLLFPDHFLSCIIIRVR